MLIVLLLNVKRLALFEYTLLVYVRFQQQTRGMDGSALEILQPPEPPVIPHTSYLPPPHLPPHSREP